jgi:hypothetical protein
MHLFKNGYFSMKKYWILTLPFFLWNCGPKPQAWFCSSDGYYQYKAIITMNVFPNQPIYHVGDTVTVSFYWPAEFTDSMSGVNFSFNDQEKANPYTAIYYLDDDSLYPANGVDTTFDLMPVYGNAPESYFGGYPDYYLDYMQVDTGLILSYKITFHTPGRFLHTTYMLPLNLDDMGVFLGNCRGEIAEFHFNVNQPDYYASIAAIPRPFDLQGVYDSYDYYRQYGGFIFNVQP